MKIDKRQIENNINLLVSNGSPPVKYLTHKYLLKNDLCSNTMQKLWKEVENCSVAKEIFSKQKPDGSWFSDGSWATKPSYTPKHGYSAFTPKYVTTIWILSILGDLGFSIQVKRVKKACEYALSFQKPTGRFSRFKVDQTIQKKRDELIHSDAGNFPCTSAVYLRGLGKVGMSRDDRLKKSYDLLLHWQREDGGWVNQKHKEEKNWTRSCPWVTYHATAALYYSRIPKYKNALHNALKFLVWNLSIKNDQEIQKFFYHGHNMVRELLMLSETGVCLDERSVQVILEWLYSMYSQKEGCFRYTGKQPSEFNQRKNGVPTKVAKFRLYHIIEDDWLTYYMTRIGMNLIQQKAG